VLWYGEPANRGLSCFSPVDFRTLGPLINASVTAGRQHRYPLCRERVCTSWCANVDEFVVTVRDMAAWALVTPAAHIPVAGIQDSSGYVSTVVGPPNDPAAPPDSVLALFRRTLTAGVSRAKARAVGLAYLGQEIPPRASRAVNVVVVEVDSRDGYRANVVFPYTRDEEQRPVFGAFFTLPGALQAFGPRRD
jgi:hypothetical protein